MSFDTQKSEYALNSGDLGLLREYVKPLKKETEYQSFGSFIDKISKERDMDRRGIAERIGQSVEMVRKVIGGQKITKKRDFIIAICMALEMSVENTNKALNLYNNMPELNEDDYRDRIIITAIDRVQDIKTLNGWLNKRGFKELDIKGVKKKIPIENFGKGLKKSKYKQQNGKVSVSYGDSFESSLLAHKYVIENYVHTGYAILESEDGKTYKVLVSDGDYYALEITEKSEIIGVSTIFDEEMEEAAREVEHLIKRERRKTLEILHDTRNFIQRTSAKVEEAKLVLFAECYNYEAPIANEYYRLSWCSDGYQLAISHRSTFMKMYLGNKYDEYYKEQDDEIVMTIESMETFEKRCEQQIQFDFTGIWSQRYKYFMSMKKELEKLFTELKERKQFISYPMEEDEDGCVYELFKVEKEFDCYRDEEDEDIIIPRKDSFTTQQGILITRDELYQAVELGIYSIDEICQVKKTRGSLAALFDIGDS